MKLQQAVEHEHKGYWHMNTTMTWYTVTNCSYNLDLDYKTSYDYHYSLSYWSTRVCGTPHIGYDYDTNYCYYRSYNYSYSNNFNFNYNPSYNYNFNCDFDYSNYNPSSTTTTTIPTLIRVKTTATTIMITTYYETMTMNYHDRSDSCSDHEMLTQEGLLSI